MTALNSRANSRFYAKGNFCCTLKDVVFYMLEVKNNHCIKLEDYNIQSSSIYASRNSSRGNRDIGPFALDTNSNPRLRLAYKNEIMNYYLKGKL